MTATSFGRTAVGANSLIVALENPACYPHAVTAVRVIETHISWVFLTGQYAYKIKKPVNAGFADFSSLELRKHFCEEELRLNRRLAPGLYLEVVPIGGSTDAPRVGGAGPALEYAVKMREFPQDALASRAIEDGRLEKTAVEELAVRIAAFHATAPRTPAEGGLGAPAGLLRSAMQNFEQMLPLVTAPADRNSLLSLRRWTRREFARGSAIFHARKAAGFVRECHGDLHLGNIALIDGRPVPFDCIEFSAELRWIDVMSELAFVVMDIEDRRRGDLAWCFLNRHLEETGDYEGIRVLRFYLVYRALVRAKVHLMQSAQFGADAPENLRLMNASQEYLQHAARYAAPAHPILILTHGLSGCGKTTCTQMLTGALGAIRLRSDLERKRMAGLGALHRSDSALNNGIYTPAATAATYRRLGALARDVLVSGFSAIVDATFLERVDREALRAIASACNVPMVVLDFHAPLQLLRDRVRARQARADDASEAGVPALERQIATREPLTPAEIAASLVVDSTLPPEHSIWQQLPHRIRLLVERVRPP